jgi:predicted transcriptional regulator
LERRGIIAVMTKQPELNDSLTLRLGEDLRKRLEEAADQDRRPMSNLIRCALSDWLDDRSHTTAGAQHR